MQPLVSLFETPHEVELSGVWRGKKTFRVTDVVFDRVTGTVEDEKTQNAARSKYLYKVISQQNMAWYGKSFLYFKTCIFLGSILVHIRAFPTKLLYFSDLIFQDATHHVLVFGSFEDWTT
jgi:hypothetical protein